MKILYIIIRDGGDGSYHPVYTMNSDWIDKMIEKDEAGELDYDSGWADGDGFHFDTLNVPDSCTLTNLGIGYDAADEYNPDEDSDE